MVWPWGVEHISQMAHFNFSLEREVLFDSAAMFDHLKSSVLVRHWHWLRGC